MTCYTDLLARRRREAGDRYREVLFGGSKRGGQQEVLDAMREQYEAFGPTPEERERMKKTILEGSWEDDAADSNR